MKNKKWFVALAALAAACNADALTRSFEGTGEAVLLPYYHAGDGEATLFGVTNHSDQAKAVRVVIAEGRNGRATLTFNIYLAPRDTWNGALSPGSDQDVPRLFSNDETCTAPSMEPQGAVLRNSAYASPHDGYGITMDRFQHGSIEFIELGVPVGVAAQLVDTHQCHDLIRRFAEGGVWRTAPNTDIQAPSGGLSGEARIIDVAGGVAYASEPVVLDDFSFGARHGNPNEHKAVRFFKPTASPEVGGFIVGDAQIPIDRPADAVSLLLMSTAFEAGYLLGDTLDASTRVVVTMPTRAAYLDNRPGGFLPEGTAPIAPFNGDSAEAPGCMDTEWQAIDEAGEDGPVETLPLCHQVNPIHLAEQADGFARFVTGNDTGRVRIDLSSEERIIHYGVSDGVGLNIRTARGLPAVVQSLTEVRNANAQPGILASYAISHRILRETDNDTEF